MSDSEFEYTNSQCAPSPQKKAKKQRSTTTVTVHSATPKTSKAKAQRVIESSSESEVDSPPVAAPLVKKAAAKPRIKKQPAPEQPSSGKKNIFNNILRAEEKAAHQKEEKKVLWSSFTSRVASGRQRRAVAVGEGGFYIDLKVYNSNDALTGNPQTLYKKSLVALKLQATEGSPPWEKLQSFMEDAYAVFKDTDPVVYKD